MGAREVPVRKESFNQAHKRKDMIKPIKPPERTFGFGGLIMNKEFKSKCLFFLMVQDLNSCFRDVFLVCLSCARDT